MTSETTVRDRIAALECLLEADSSLSVNAAVRTVAEAHGVPPATLRVQYYRAKSATATHRDGDDQDDHDDSNDSDDSDASDDSDPLPGARELASAVEDKVLAGIALLDALEEVTTDSDVTVGAVRSAYYRHRSDEVRVLHGNAALTIIQDRALTTAALALDAMLYPPSSADIEVLAKSLGGGAFSYDHKWGRRWLQGKQHEGVLSKPRRTKSITEGRANQQQMRASVEKFAHDWALHIQLHSAPPASATINIDETLLVAMEDRLRVQRVTRAGRGRASVTGGRGGNTIGSLVAFVNAAGECLFRVFVLKVKSHDGVAELSHVVLPKAETQGSGRNKVPTRLMYTASGLVDEAHYHTIVKLFCDLWTTSHGVGAATSDPATLHAYVFADQLAAHRARATVEYALKKNVFLWSLPRNTSHITQPLDDVPFATFKSELRELFMAKKQQRLQADMKPRYKELLLEAAWDAAAKAFTPAIIKHAFKSTHLYPFDADDFVAHCERAIGTKIADDVEQLQHRAAEGIVAMFTEAKKTTAKEEAAVHAIAPSLKVVLTDVHDPRELLRLSDAHKKVIMQQKEAVATKKEEKTANMRKRKREAEERAAERAKNTCQHVDKETGVRCKTVHRSGGNWGSCTLCNAYKLCPKHTTDKKLRHHAVGCFPLERKKAKNTHVESKKGAAGVVAMDTT